MSVKLLILAFMPLLASTSRHLHPRSFQSRFVHNVGTKAGFCLASVASLLIHTKPSVADVLAGSALKTDELEVSFDTSFLGLSLKPVNGGSGSDTRIRLAELKVLLHLH